MTDGHRPFRRRVLVNTAWTGVGTGWAMVVTIVTLPLTLHGLGETAFGTWVLLNTFSAMTGWFSIADIGVGTAATREIASRVAVDDLQGARHVITGTLFLFVTFGIAFGTLFALLGPFVLPRVFDTPTELVSAFRFAIVVFAFQLVVDQASNSIQASLDGFQRTDLSRAADGIRRTLVAGGVAIAAVAGGGLEGVALVSAAGSIGGLLAALVILRHLERGWWRHRPRRPDMQGLLSYGRSVAAIRPIGVIHRQMDRVIVGAILGPAAVALVEIATQIQNGAEATLSSATYAVSPAAAWIRARGAEGPLRELVVLGTKYSVLVTLPLVVGGMLLSGPIVAVWVGPAQSAAAGLAALALAYTGVTCMFQVSSGVLVGIGRPGPVRRALIGAIVVNLVMSVVLVHLIGTAGAFIATLLGAVFIAPFILTAALAEAELDLGTFLRQAIAPVVPPLAAMAIVVGIVVLLPLGNLSTLLIGVSGGALTYGTASTFFAVRRDEIRDLLAGLRRGPSDPAT